MPGAPGESGEAVRLDRQLDFQALYKKNCAGCHGDNGRGGAAIPLNNPAYLACAGVQNLHDVAAKGLPGALMPAFAQSAGGTLTDQQVDALVQGMMREWGRPSEFAAVALPPYSASAAGNSSDGQKTYTAACARCHGADGTGIRTPSQTTAGQQAEIPHSIVDSSYLGLIGNQSLRSYVVAGHLDANAPDWRSYLPGRALTAEEISDVVAWIASHRTTVAQQPVEAPGSALAGTAKKENP
jgi:mono/diheme cytochrome c family protein